MFRRIFSAVVGLYKMVVDATRELFIRILMGILIFLGYVLLSLFIYAVVRRIMVPQKLHTLPVHLQYTPGCSGPTCPFPQAELLLNGGKKLLSSGQYYKVSLDMELPETWANQDVGVFMVNLTFYTADKQFLVTSARPAMIRYKSFLLRIIYTLFFAVPLLLGLWEQKQVIELVLFEGFYEPYGEGALSALVTLQHHGVQVYSTKLSIEANFSGFTYYLYQWPISMSVIVVISIFITLCTCTVVMWVRDVLEDFDLRRRSALQRRRLLQQQQARTAGQTQNGGGGVPGTQRRGRHLRQGQVQLLQRGAGGNAALPPIVETSGSEGSTVDTLTGLEEVGSVVLSRSLAGVLPPIYSSPTQSNTFTQQNKSDVFPQPLATPTYEAPNTTPPPPSTYPTPYTPPTQLDPYTPSRLTELDSQHMSPTAFLNLSSGDQGGGRGNMDMSQLPNYAMKPEPITRSSNQNNCMYSLPSYQQGNESPSYNSINRSTVTSPEDIFSMQASLQHKVDDMEGAFGGARLLPSPHTPPRPHTLPRTTNAFHFPNSSVLSQQQQQYSAPLSGNHMTSTRDHMIGQQPPFVRVSSAGNLRTISSPIPAARPPLERGKSEPIRRLHEQVQKLSAENEKQLMEINKQKSFAEKQYTELLQTVMHQQAASGKASEQQQQVLQSVLSDPSLVDILRNVLLSTPAPGGGGVMGQEVGGGAGKISLSELHMKGGGHTVSDLTSPPNVVSPTDLAKVTGVSDFQSRLLVAAASQAAQVSSTGESSFTSAATSQVMSPYSSFLSGGSDTETTPTGSALSLRIKPARKLSTEEKEAYRELRRQSHISAEQKRRGSIKQGFDHLQSLVVNLSAYPSGKVSKAVILEKTIEHIHHCHVARDERERKISALQKEIEDLNTAIARCQEMLPASGVPVTRQRFEENRQRFREYVQRRTQQNYKFWIFSIILKQLFESYNSMVSTGSVDELCRTVLAWFEQHCALPALRPVVMASLRELSQKTTILTDPSQVPRQLAQYAQQEMQLHRQEQEKARTTRLSFS